MVDGEPLAVALLLIVAMRDGSEVLNVSVVGTKMCFFCMGVVRKDYTGRGEIASESSSDARMIRAEPAIEGITYVSLCFPQTTTFFVRFSCTAKLVMAVICVADRRGAPSDSHRLLVAYSAPIIPI